MEWFNDNDVLGSALKFFDPRVRNVITTMSLGTKYQSILKPHCCLWNQIVASTLAYVVIFVSHILLNFLANSLVEDYVLGS